jgi:hypothetical protein
MALTLLIAVIVLMPLMWPCGVVEAVATPDDEHEDIFDEWDGTEGTWIPLPKTPPEGQEIVLTTDRTTGKPGEGKLVEHISTGTNDFFISVRRNDSGEWRVSPNSVILTDSNGREYNKDIHKSLGAFLLEALERKWELRMEIPKEVAAKMSEGYLVGVAASDVQNFVAGPKYEKFQPLTMNELFYLNKGLQYKFEGEFLYIKCHPQIHMRRNYYYEDIFPDFIMQGIPIVQKRFGSNPHNMLDLDENPLGSTSTILEEELLLQQDLTPSQKDALRKEVEKANGATYIHFSQIKNSKGDLYGKEKDEIPFEFYYWTGEGEGFAEKSDKARVGDGKSFANGIGVGLWFWYPLELTFYLANTEDVAVLGLDYGDLEPSSTATATVTVFRAAGRDEDAAAAAASVTAVAVAADDEERTALLTFSLNNRIVGRKNVTLRRDETLQVDFPFTTPQNGSVVMKAEINPEPRAFEEITYENNSLTAVAMVGSYNDLP